MRPLEHAPSLRSGTRDLGEYSASHGSRRNREAGIKCHARGLPGGLQGKPSDPHRVMICKTCNGRGWIQSGLAGESLERCPDCTPCDSCGGEETIDSGGVTPWGAAINVPCPACAPNKLARLAAIGAAWEKDSSLEKWFPCTAERLAHLELVTAKQAEIIRGFQGARNVKHDERRAAIDAALNDEL